MSKILIHKVLAGAITPTLGCYVYQSIPAVPNFYFAAEAGLSQGISGGDRGDCVPKWESKRCLSGSSRSAEAVLVQFCPTHGEVLNCVGQGSNCHGSLFLKLWKSHLGSTSEFKIACQYSAVTGTWGSWPDDKQKVMAVREFAAL